MMDARSKVAFNREYDLSLGVLQILPTRNEVVEEELRCFRDEKHS